KDFITVPSVLFSGAASATASLKATAASIASGGSGYSPNDTITLAGGVFSEPVVLGVNTVTGTAIASVSVISAGNYSSLPTNAAAQATTSGTGTGATFNLTWGMKAVTVANPGSGYDSPPASIS